MTFKTMTTKSDEIRDFFGVKNMYGNYKGAIFIARMVRFRPEALPGYNGGARVDALDIDVWRFDHVADLNAGKESEYKEYTLGSSSLQTNLKQQLEPGDITAFRLWQGMGPKGAFYVNENLSESENVKAQMFCETVEALKPEQQEQPEELSLEDQMLAELNG